MNPPLNLSLSLLQIIFCVHSQPFSPPPPPADDGVPLTNSGYTVYLPLVPQPPVYPKAHSVSSRRFSKVLPPEEIQQRCQQFLPLKMNQCNPCAASVYMDVQWADKRNSDLMVRESCPVDFLSAPYLPQVVDY